MSLLACPFCRELFAPGEAERCPACGLALADASRLPPSHDALAEADDFDLPTPPHLQPLPGTHLGHSRGLLIACAVLGLVAFASPWIVETSPETVVLSGLDLARRRGWFWSAGVAWFVLLPVVLSRRTLDQMRGARVAAAMLSAIPLLTAALLYVVPVRSRVPLRFGFGLGLGATLALGLVATAAACFFGGKLPTPASPAASADAPPTPAPKRRGRVLH